MIKHSNQVRFTASKQFSVPSVGIEGRTEYRRHRENLEVFFGVHRAGFLDVYSAVFDYPRAVLTLRGQVKVSLEWKGAQLVANLHPTRRGLEQADRSWTLDEVLDWLFDLSS